MNKKTCESNTACLSEKGGNCKLLIPGNNLLSENDNEDIYYTRMDDELHTLRKYSLHKLTKEIYRHQDIGYNSKN